MILPKFFDRLKGEKRWVAWTKVPIERPGRNPLKAKTPLDIRDHGGQTGARANDPATWGTLDEVYRLAQLAGIAESFANVPHSRAWDVQTGHGNA